MTGQPHFGSREREVLTAIVRTYIENGEPVGSRTVSRLSRDGLSPATIRNVMADLTDVGMLEQPHTSAGRVPTSKAYRYFVDQISGTGDLTAESQEMIEDSFSGVTDAGEFLARTSRVLSLISTGVGVSVVHVASGRHTLEHIYFSRLSCQKVLAVVVTRAGIVRDRVLRLQRDLTQAELDTAARFINETFQGWTIDSLRIELARRLEQERNEYDSMMRSVEDLYRGGALQGAAGETGVFVDGVSNLLVSDADRARLRELMRILEEKQRVAELLSAYVDATQEAVRVVVGLEDTMPEMRNLVLIGAPARIGSEMVGSLAVIGPTRIDYEHTMTAVRYIAGLFDKILND
ncbi:MAG: heat-inducible transcriptional repressor HrcA [Acidobacteriaceae bacterium]